VIVRRLLPVIVLALGLGVLGGSLQTPAARIVVAAPAPVAPPKVATPEGTFLVKPYLQLGDAAALAPAERLEVMWHSADTDAAWTIETRPATGGAWKKAGAPAFRCVAVPSIEPHRLYHATISGLAPGAEFDYQVVKDSKPVFAARARARKSASQPFRFVVFGDCAANTPGQRAVAYQTYLSRPDFVFITGDIVYSRGRISEYQTKYWPVYNAEEASPATGAPLIRSTLFLAAPGNHDTANRDLDMNPDTLAYFFYWAQPLNGPLGTGGAANTPTLLGAEANQQAFLAAAGTAYPRMANFSFDYGNAHWTVLDANTYVNWDDPALRAWVEKDLAAAKSATWRFVGFHQPGFNSSKSHFAEQQMRRLADVFEKGGVDIVFAGHVHNYQRSFPLRFAVKRGPDGKPLVEERSMVGELKLDKAYDGQTRTKPDGVIYLVTGGGGAGLYNPEQQNDPASWQPFTTKFIADTHSLTVVDVDGKSLTVRQVSEDGKELDRFTVSR
jgi:predicted phosphodiesterase